MNEEGKLRNTAEQIKAGDTYIWAWYNWGGQEKGTELQTNGKDLMEILFVASSMVSVTLEGKGKAVLVTLKQFDIPTDEKSVLNIHHGFSNCWSFWLANLKSYLEYGNLLYENEFDLTNIPLAGFQFVNI